MVGSLRLDGQILADGGQSGCGPGGSGGGIYVAVGQLAGTGSIRARGSDQSGCGSGAGGGGRVAGDSGSVPLTIFSSVGLTNFNLKLLVPTNRFATFGLSNVAPEVATSLVNRLSDTEAWLRFTNQSGLVLTGAQQLGVLTFTTTSNLNSAFVPLRATNITAARADGVIISNFNLQPGRVTVIGNEPLVEAVKPVGQSSGLILYGRPGSSYRLERATSVSDSIGWQPWKNLPMLTLQTNLPPFLGTDAQTFFRAVDFQADPPFIELWNHTGDQVQWLIYTTPGEPIALQRTTSLAPLPLWDTLLNTNPVGSFVIPQPVSMTNDVEVFRIRTP